MLTINDVKEFMRIDHDAEDGFLSVLLVLAKEMCENYLRHDLPEQPIESIRLAQLMIIGHFYENRTGATLPSAVYRLLDAYRDEVF